MLLLLDNYDSFVFNLARYFERLGQETRVVRNDAVDARAIAAMAPRAIVISPGPCTPAEAGCSVDVVRQLHERIPILGVCLGHQAIAAAFGGRIVRAAEPVHGRTSEVTHDGRGVFAGLPNPLTVCRYHSLIIDEATLPSELEVSARLGDESPDGAPMDAESNVGDTIMAVRQIMAVRHWEHPVVGVQFHPEAILTDAGYQLLANFLELAGIDAPAANRPGVIDERPTPPPASPEVSGPVTF